MCVCIGESVSGDEGDEDRLARLGDGSKSIGSLAEGLFVGGAEFEIGIGKFDFAEIDDPVGTVNQQIHLNALVRIVAREAEARKFVKNRRNSQSICNLTIMYKTGIFKSIAAPYAKFGLGKKLEEDVFLIVQSLR